MNKLRLSSSSSSEEDGADADEDFEIEALLGRRKCNKDGGWEYLVKWKGYDDPKDNTWEPEEGLMEVSAGCCREWFGLHKFAFRMLQRLCRSSRRSTATRTRSTCCKFPEYESLKPADFRASPKPKKKRSREREHHHHRVRDSRSSSRSDRSFADKAEAKRKRAQSQMTPRIKHEEDEQKYRPPSASADGPSTSATVNAEAERKMRALFGDDEEGSSDRSSGVEAKKKEKKKSSAVPGLNAPTDARSKPRASTPTKVGGQQPHKPVCILPSPDPTSKCTWNLRLKQLTKIFQTHHHTPTKDAPSTAKPKLPSVHGDASRKSRSTESAAPKKSKTPVRTEPLPTTATAPPRKPASTVRCAVEKKPKRVANASPVAALRKRAGAAVTPVAEEEVPVAPAEEEQPDGSGVSYVELLPGQSNGFQRGLTVRWYRQR